MVLIIRTQTTSSFRLLWHMDFDQATLIHKISMFSDVPLILFNEKLKVIITQADTCHRHMLYVWQTHDMPGRHTQTT